MDRWQQEPPEGHLNAVDAMRASICEQDQRINRLVGLFVSGEFSREHSQSLRPTTRRSGSARPPPLRVDEVLHPFSLPSPSMSQRS